MDLSIIIINWKSASCCADCLSSIYACPLPISFEIIVIDNASFDGCGEMICQMFPSVHFIQSKVNLGFAAANNLGFSKCCGSVVCFLNPDTIVKGDALQILYDAVLNTPGAGAVGARLLNSDGSLQTSCVLPMPTILNQSLDIEFLRNIFPRSRLFGIEALFSEKRTPQKVEAISGACIMIQRQTFLKAGMFSTDYFMYSEDIDLCYKIKLTGLDIYLINTAEIVHLGGKSSSKQKNHLFSALLIRQSTYQFLCKYRGHGYALVFRVVFGISAIVRLAILLFFLGPVALIGRGRWILYILQRWWYQLAWVAGVSQVSQYPATKAIEK